MSQTLQTIIDQAWDNRANLSPSSAPQDVRDAVSQVLAGLNDGSIRVAERQSVGQWHVNQWVKKAVLISFRLEDNQVMSSGPGSPSSMTKSLLNLLITVLLTSPKEVSAWYRLPWPVVAHSLAKMSY